MRGVDSVLIHSVISEITLQWVSTSLLPLTRWSIHPAQVVSSRCSYDVVLVKKFAKKVLCDLKYYSIYDEHKYPKLKESNHIHFQNKSA
jgi:hypothetical protein